MGGGSFVVVQASRHKACPRKCWSTLNAQKGFAKETVNKNIMSNDSLPRSVHFLRCDTRNEVTKADPRSCEISGPGGCSRKNYRG